MRAVRAIPDEQNTLKPDQLEKLKTLFEREITDSEAESHLARLHQERAAIREQLKHVYDGTRMEALPPDLYKGYGRIREIDAQIAHLESEKYVGWPEQDRRAAEEAGRILRLDEQTPERRERLEHLLDTERGHIQDTTNLPIALSRRLAAETVAWREGITWKEPQMLEREREILCETLSQRASEITFGWRAVEVVTAVEAGAALNYWRGRAEEFNATREAIVRHHPELAKDVPALEIDEIQVRQRVLERERSEEKSLAVTP